jgi:hypothetical protein
MREEEEMEAQREVATRTAMETSGSVVMELDDEDKSLEEEEMNSDLDEVVRKLDTASPTKKQGRTVGGNKGRAKSYAQALAPTGALRPSSFIPYNYSNPRVIIEGSMRLSSDDKVVQFIRLIGILLTNGKMVDPFFVINPIIIGGGKKDLRDAKDMPQNIMAMGGYIKISEKRLQTFQKKTSGATGGKKSTGVNQAYADVVYFTMTMSCDVSPSELITGILVEWMRAGAIGLYRKEIQAFNTFSPFVILKLSINVVVLTLVEEFRRIMEEAMKLVEEEAMADGEMISMVIPPFAFRKSQPKLPGLDPAEYAGLSS